MCLHNASSKQDQDLLQDIHTLIAAALACCSSSLTCLQHHTEMSHCASQAGCSLIWQAYAAPHKVESNV